MSSDLKRLDGDIKTFIRQRGHNDATEFAMAIGWLHGYANDISAKKDVIDLSGDAHSVKSGNKKWQIFLYGNTRFQNDDAFTVMNFDKGINGMFANLLQTAIHATQAGRRPAGERANPKKKYFFPAENPRI